MQPSPIIRSDDLRSENRARVLSTLRRSGPLPRAELGELTGLSQASLSTLTSQLFDEGVLDIRRNKKPLAEGAAPSRGRPSSNVSLAPSAACVLTLSLSIDRLRAAVIDYAGHETGHLVRQLDTRSLDASKLLEQVFDIIDAMLLELPTHSSIKLIGVAFQGTTGNERGELLWSPIIGGQNIQLGDALSSRYGVPSRVNNDCALIARALHQTHGDVLGPHFATVLFSHGVGLGLFLNDQAFSGIRSSALEIGHLQFERNGALCRCGRRGCVEAYAADYGIARLIGDGAIDDPPPGRVTGESIEHFVDDALNGDVAAIQALAIAGAAVGDGLAKLFTLFDPMPVALVGRSDAAFTLMAEALHGALDAAGREKPDLATDLFCFADADPLINEGVALDSLNAVDRLIAADSSESADREPTEVA